MKERVLVLSPPPVCVAGTEALLLVMMLMADDDDDAIGYLLTMADDDDDAIGHLLVGVLSFARCVSFFHVRSCWPELVHAAPCPCGLTQCGWAMSPLLC